MDFLWKLKKQALRVQQASTATPRVGFIVWIRRLLRSEVFNFFCSTLHQKNYTTLYYTTILHYIALHCIELLHTVSNISSVSNQSHDHSSIDVDFVLSLPMFSIVYFEWWMRRVDLWVISDDLRGLLCVSVDNSTFSCNSWAPNSWKLWRFLG